MGKGTSASRSVAYCVKIVSRQVVLRLRDVIVGWVGFAVWRPGCLCGMLLQGVEVCIGMEGGECGWSKDLGVISLWIVRRDPSVWSQYSDINSNLSDLFLAREALQ